MLSHVMIRNLVIVKSLELNFEPGMTAMTGETGAGKSILVDALGLALGDKADSGLIREGAEQAEIGVSFDLPADSEIRRWLDERDLADDDGCLVRRVLNRNGRSRAYVNGSPTTLGTLRSLGELLVDIHGQHAHQSLLKAAVQRQLLDDYGDLQQLVEATAAQYRRWQSLAAEYEQLSRAASDRAARLDYLQFQLDELDALPCGPDEVKGLEAEHDRLAHAEQLLADTGLALDRLTEGDPSMRSLLADVDQLLAGLGAIDPALSETRGLIESAAIQIDEAATNLRHYEGALEPDPARLAELDGQLSRLHDLARKHRVAPGELGGLRDALREEATTLLDADNSLTQLEAGRDQAAEAYAAAAAALSDARSATAARLAGTITASLQELGMQGGVFEVAVTPRPGRPTVHGIDQISFLVAANPGQKPGALNDVASGGELSRISLAIQVATANCARVPTLIFDEVDVGIGGATAEIVGQLLRRLGNERQVLCVTHLPQVASQAHQQLRVVKRSDGTTTETRIDALAETDRVDEIARMLGGVSITEQTRRHADEMIRQARTGE